MTTKFVFADEAGCFTFKRKPGASKYFLLCTVSTYSCTPSTELLNIRRKLCANGDPDRDKLHATTDRQATRDAVFGLLEKHIFRVDATILEKSKAQPQTHIDEPTFYQYAWYFHFKHVAPHILKDAEKLHITAAALGTNKTKAAFKLALNNTLQQLIPREKWECTFIESAKDPMLWVADYCAWAIQRKWEADDDRSHKLIKEKISSEFDLWAIGQTHYY